MTMSHDIVYWKAHLFAELNVEISKDNVWISSSIFFFEIVENLETRASLHRNSAAVYILKKMSRNFTWLLEIFLAKPYSSRTICHIMPAIFFEFIKRIKLNFLIFLLYYQTREFDYS